MRRQVLRKETIGDTRGDEEKHTFADKKPEEKANRQQGKPLGFTECRCCLAAIEDPNGDEVQDIQTRG